MKSNGISLENFNVHLNSKSGERHRSEPSAAVRNRPQSSAVHYAALGQPRRTPLIVMRCMADVQSLSYLNKSNYLMKVHKITVRINKVFKNVNTSAIEVQNSERLVQKQYE